jgi:hypothetical protein
LQNNVPHIREKEIIAANDLDKETEEDVFCFTADLENVKVISISIGTEKSLNFVTEFLKIIFKYK